MDDLEMTRLCAEAMELRVVLQLGQWRFPATQHEFSLYDPLHDDAQAMALQKRYCLQVLNQLSRSPGLYYAEACSPEGTYGAGHSDNMNRAIVEAVAKMQRATRSAAPNLQTGLQSPEIRKPERDVSI